jgi:hypothetical protein
MDGVSLKQWSLLLLRKILALDSGFAVQYTPLKAIKHINQ